MRATDNSLAFVVAAALKWGGTLWLCLVLGRVIYRLKFGNDRLLLGSLIADLLVYAAVALVFCLFVGFIMGLLRARENDQTDEGRQ